MRSLLFKILVILITYSFILTISATPLFAAAEIYPSKPVRIIVPEVAGAGADIVARLIATKLSERLGQQFLVDNRGGAGGIIGVEMAAKANPDGYTLLFVAASFTIKPALQKLPYDPVKSFTPIAKLGGGPYSLVVIPSIPANSVKELIALAKQKPNQLIFVTSGATSTPHMSAELFKMMANIDFKIVHFKGITPGLTDMLGGHSHALLGSLLTSLPHIKSGKFRVLGIGGVKRSFMLPDVPTIAEAGLPGFNASGWYGLAAPAGTSTPIIDRLNKEIEIFLASDEGKKSFWNAGQEVDYLGTAEFGTFLNEEIARWTGVVKKANIKVE
jgi:tripartite-type tricarboxylate transporter receptor subunit TctC